MIRKFSFHLIDKQKELNMKKAAIPLILIALMSQNAMAKLMPTSISVSNHAECMVADPTGTLLNVRERPAGVRLGSLKNGTKLTLTHFEEDDRGRTWSYVKWKGQPLDKATAGSRQQGWVIREYISCKLQ